MSYSLLNQTVIKPVRILTAGRVYLDKLRLFTIKVSNCLRFYLDALDIHCVLFS